MGVHAESRSGVDLADPAAGLADRLADVWADEVDPGDVQAHHAGGLLGDLDVVGVSVVGAVDGDSTGAHVPGGGKLHLDSGGRNVVHREALRGDEFLGSLIDPNPGENLLVAHPAARVGVDDVHEFAHGVFAVADHVGGNPLSNRDHAPAHHQHPVVLARVEGLHDHPPTARLLLRGRERRRHGILVA